VNNKLIKNIMKAVKIILIIFIAFLPMVVFAATLINPVGEDDPRVIIGTAIKGALSILGSLALAMFVYGGFVWMLSFGSPDKVKKGRDILVWAFIGLVIIFASYAIVSFVMGEGLLSPFLLI